MTGLRTPIQRELSKCALLPSNHALAFAAKIRRAFGFSAPSFDRPWRAFLALDELMGTDPAPDPRLGAAFAHPRSNHALEQAAEAFAALPVPASDLASRRSQEPKARAAERLARRALEDMLSMGISREHASALLAHAHFRRASRCLDAGLASGRSDPLAQICSLTSTLALDLGCNAISAELLAGTLGSWLYSEATLWNPPKDFTFALHWLGAPPPYESPAPPNSPPIGKWACAELSAAERMWDFSDDAPAPCPLAMARIAALAELSDLIHDALGEDIPASYAKLRAKAQSSLIARASTVRAPIAGNSRSSL